MTSKFYKIDWISLICSFFLIGIGVFTLLSMTSEDASSNGFFHQEFNNQLIFILISVVLGIIIFLITPVYFRFRPMVFGIFILTALLLIATLYFGTEIRGVRRWITLGGSVDGNGNTIGGITIQASEMAKLSMIVVGAALLSFHENQKRSKEFIGVNFVNKLKVFLEKNFYLMLFYIINLVILTLIMLQKSLTVSIVISFLILTLLLANQQSKTRFMLYFFLLTYPTIATQDAVPLEIPGWIHILSITFLIGIAGLAFFSRNFLNPHKVVAAIFLGFISGFIFINFFWNYVLKDYQRQRITTYFTPGVDDVSAANNRYQQRQALISIGSGQAFGTGFGRSSDNRVLLQPEPTTDFIFAVYANKFGYIGTTLLSLVYMILILRLIYLSDQMNDRFSSLVLLGVAGMLIVQFFFNTAMNLEKLPVGGTTLPLISAGGSSLLTTVIALAVTQNIIATNRIQKINYVRKDTVMIEGWNV